MLDFGTLGDRHLHCQSLSSCDGRFAGYQLGVDGKLPLQPAEDLDGIEQVREKRHVPSGLDKSLNALD